MTITGRPRSARRIELGGRQRAAAVLGHEQVERVSDRSGRARPRSVYGPRSSRTSQRGGSGGSGGSMQRTRNQAVHVPAKADEALPPGGQEDPAAEAGDGRGRRGRVVDPVPVVAGALASSPGARDGSSGTPAVAQALAAEAEMRSRERVRRVHDGRDALLSPARRRAPRVRRSRPRAPRPRAVAGSATRPASDEITAHAVARERAGERARLGRCRRAQHAHGHGDAGRSRAAE